MTAALEAPSDPAYTGPQLPDELAQTLTQVQFPWWFNQGPQPATPAPVTPPQEPQAPAAPGVPAAGPFTVSFIVKFILLAGREVALVPFGKHWGCLSTSGNRFMGTVQHCIDGAWW
jgi:hypothetical protein